MESTPHGSEDGGLGKEVVGLPSSSHRGTSDRVDGPGKDGGDCGGGGGDGRGDSGRAIDVGVTRGVSELLGEYAQEEAWWDTLPKDWDAHIP
eukprot:5997424-Pyramimonas_sp.AAC.2